MQEIFLTNKYSKWYFAIIKNRVDNPIKDNSYVEKHHIIPKSIGGSNKKENLVALTPKEHFVCHLLLVKMTTGKFKTKMSYALRLLSHIENEHQSRHKISARAYSLIVSITKPALSNAISGINNPFYGRTHSDESKEKMKAKRAIQKPPMLGKTRSEETKEKLREANRKQFLDPRQIEMRRNCNKIEGMVIYHNPITKQTKYFYENTQPEGFIRGRFKQKEVVL